MCLDTIHGVVGPFLLCVLFEYNLTPALFEQYVVTASKFDYGCVHAPLLGGVLP